MAASQENSVLRSASAVQMQDIARPLVTVDEQISGSLSQAFSTEGYPREDVTLINAGQAEGQLINSRSAAEYGLSTNGASSDESPSALQMAAGNLARLFRRDRRG